MILLSRNVLIHPHSRRLQSSSASRVIISHIQPHKLLNTSSKNDSKRCITSTITNLSVSNSTGIGTDALGSNSSTTTNFKPSNRTLADQVLDDITPPSKFSAPANSRRRQHNNSIFPWRHSPHPLPRLTPNTVEEYEEGGEFGPRFPMRTMNVAERGFLWFHSVYVLGLARPWHYGSWRRELEDGFLSAFAMGLQGVLVDVYRAPISLEDDNSDDVKEAGSDDDIDNDNDNAYSVQIDHTISNPIQDSDDDRSSDAEDRHDTDKKAQEFLSENDDGGNRNSFQPEEGPILQDMLETNLQSIYHSAHSAAKSKLQIHLECQPKSAHLISLFSVPLLTREEVRQDPSLQNLYPDLYHKLLLKAMEEMERSDGRKTSLSWRDTYGEIREFVEDKVGNQDDEGVIQMTVVAQAVIECDEVFYVRDVESGEIVQGDDDGKMKEVLHQVRFEMVVDWDWQRREMHTGNWQITDWDDLLDGNIYYLWYDVQTIKGEWRVCKIMNSKH